MKRTFKRIVSLLLAVVMVFGTAPLSGLVGLDLPEFYGLKRILDSISVCFNDFSAKAEATQDYTNETYNAIFYLDEAKTQVYEIVPTAYNERIEFPQNPSMDGLYFDGWDNSETVMGEGDMEFVALWINIEYTLTFVNEEGEYIDRLIGYWGDQIYKEDIEAICEYYYNGKPIKEGYELKYWTANGEPVIFPFEVKGDTVFEPYFSISTYSINYFVDWQLYDTNRYTFGDSISLREPIYKEGYTFSGWKNETGNDMVLPSTMPAKDINVHGTFTAIKYKAVFNAGDGFFSDGSTVKEVMVDYGQTPEVPESPTKEGELFLGWNPRLNPIGIHGAQYTAVFGKEYAYYTIEIYKMNEEGQYELTEVSQLIGNKNGTVSYTPEAIEGYAVDSKNSVLNGYVSADGSTTLKVYYMRTNFDQESTEKYKNATITLYQNSYTVKEPNLLKITGKIICPDGVDSLSVDTNYSSADFYLFSLNYEMISTTEKIFVATFSAKNPGEFKIGFLFPDLSKPVKCTVKSYKSCAPAYITEHQQFIESNEYNSFLVYKSAENLADSMRGNPSYHWNNLMSMNFFENYYDIVLAELITGETMKETTLEIFYGAWSKEFTGLLKEVFDFLDLADSGITFEEFLDVFNTNNPDYYKNTTIYKMVVSAIGNNHSNLIDAVFKTCDVIGVAGDIFSASVDVFEGVRECVYYFSAINAYRYTSEYFKDVIQKATELTDNSGLKKSLETYSSIDSESDYIDFAKSLYERAGNSTIQTAVKVFFDMFGIGRTAKFVTNIVVKGGAKLASKVVTVSTKAGTVTATVAQIASGAIAGVTLGMAVSEIITNADDYSQYASKCTHAGDFAEVFAKVLKEFENNFNDSKTIEDALRFDAAFNLYKDTQIYALTSIVQSVNAQENSLVAKLLNLKGNIAPYISKINCYRNLSCHEHELDELVTGEYYFIDEKYSGNKLIRVACPVDVYVYDSEGNLALSIENDFVEIFDDRLDAYVLNSEKYICVPLDEEFTIKIVSTDDGEMDYSVFEFDENSEMTREVSKENISLVIGKTFEGKIDNIINTDVDNYNLIVADTQETITMDNDIDCVPATNISISRSSVNLKTGQSAALYATVTPTDTTDMYAWISSNEAVATVSENGTVNAIGEGNTIIVAMVNDLIYAECEVNVVDLKDYTISWVVDGVTTLQTVTEGNTITKPSNPTKSGYTFVGWTPAVPNAMPAYDMTFTAVFEKSYICPDCGDEILGENAINDHIVSEARMKATIKIKNNNGSKTINYGETLHLTAVTTDMPTDAKIYWYVDGVKHGEGETFNVSFESGTKTVEVKIVDSNGNAIKNANGYYISDSQKVSVNSSFWQKIVSFFKNLFGINRTVVQALRNVF